MFGINVEYHSVRNMLPNYREHINNNNISCLLPILGCYELKCPNQPIYLILVPNIDTPLFILNNKVYIYIYYIYIGIQHNSNSK